MAILSKVIFGVVRWAARKGLRSESDDTRVEDADDIVDAEELEDAMRAAARQEGMRGETYAYWYLRCEGYVFIARNFSPRAAKGEIDLIGYDGETLAFVEVRTRTVKDGDLPGLPELSVTTDKECSCRFDVVAIDNRMGAPPEIRLHKDAFSPQLKAW